MNAPLLYVNFFDAFWHVASQAHKDYGGGDGKPNGMAASFEGLLAFKDAVKSHFKDADLSTTSILDAGAGASSMLLRNWFKTVITCELDKTYLEDVYKTGIVLSAKHNLPALIAGHWLECYPDFDVDCCFFDYGSHVDRMAYLHAAMLRTRRLIYVDDTDTRPECAEFRTFVQGMVRRISNGAWTFRDCTEAEDEYGRWGMLLTRE
jgi:hypothetical protein